MHAVSTNQCHPRLPTAACCPSPSWRGGLALLWTLAACLLSPGPANAETGLTVYPPEVRLLAADARQQLVVITVTDTRSIDRTRDVVYRSDDPSVVRVDEDGVLYPIASGTTSVAAIDGDAQQAVTVEVALPDVPRPVVFERDIQPILTVGGCNMGACHAKQGGKNGFQLSLFGFDDDFDYAALTKEARGRRVFPAAPDQSLILLKGTATIPHGGGQRIATDDVDYEKLHRWITAGMPRRGADAPVLDHVSVYPPDCLLAPEASQQLIVTAHYTDGTTEDVTTTSSFQSNESAIAGVSGEGGHGDSAEGDSTDPPGLIRSGKIPGEAAIMARYMGEIAVCSVGVPLPGSVSEDVYASLPNQHAIDRLVWEKLKRLGMVPSDPADEATLLRRAYIDVIGRQSPWEYLMQMDPCYSSIFQISSAGGIRDSRMPDEFSRQSR